MMNKRTILEKLEEGYDFVFNDTVTTVGGFATNAFTIVASLYYALTNKMPIMPQWAWGAIFVFMLAVGFASFENMIYLGEDDDIEEEEDEEFVED